MEHGAFRAWLAVDDLTAERSDFERAASRLKAREPFLTEGFSPALSNAALRQAFTIARGFP
jgi:hypothetical protein